MGNGVEDNRAESAERIHDSVYAPSLHGAYSDIRQGAPVRSPITHTVHRLVLAEIGRLD